MCIRDSLTHVQDVLSDAAHADQAQCLAGHFNAGGVVLRGKADRAVLVGNGNDVLRQDVYKRQEVHYAAPCLEGEELGVYCRREENGCRLAIKKRCV